MYMQAGLYLLVADTRSVFLAYVEQTVYHINASKLFLKDIVVSHGHFSSCGCFHSRLSGA